jgi:hypothetical protein
VIEDLSSDTKLVYSIPSDTRYSIISSLLKKLEVLEQVTVAIEPSTLEDAYVRALKSSQPEEIDHIQMNKHMRKLIETTGQLSSTMQFKAIFSRRLLTFKRSSSEWYLAISPVLSVIATYLILFALWQFTKVA